MTTQSNLTSALEDSLSAAWLTQDVRRETRAALAAMGELRLYRAGDILAREGDPSDFLAVVLTGRIGLRLRVPERGPITILTVEPGDVVLWSAVVPPYRATSTVSCLSDAEVAYFDGKTLRQALDTDAALAADFYPVLLRAVARRLEGTRLQLLDVFSQRGVEPW